MKIKISLYRFIFILLIITLISIGYDYYARITGVSGAQTDKEDITINIPPPEVNPDNWTTYTHPGDSFQISHPKFFYVSKQKNEPFDVTFLHQLLKDTDLEIALQPRIEIYISDTGLLETAEQANESRNADQFPEYAEIDINGKKAYQSKALDPNIVYTQTIIGDEAEAYIIQLFTIETDVPELVQIYNEMLNSFQY